VGKFVRGPTGPGTIRVGGIWVVIASFFVVALLVVVSDPNAVI
jgi:hypothetical protein